MSRKWLLVPALLCWTSTPALAQERERDTEHDTEHEVTRASLILAETAALIVPPTIYYWNTVQDQKEDWELRWDWPSWQSKLFSTDELVLDTNRFMPNEVRHPLTGAAQYDIGRFNGLSPWASLALDFAGSVFWEYIVEYRECPSINDIFTNTWGGLVIGEPLYQIGHAWLEHDAPHTRFALSAAPSITRFDAGDTRRELALGGELGIVRDREVDRAGEGTSTTGFAGWNRELLEMRLGEATDSTAVTGFRFRSETTYWARYSRDFDDLGSGTSHLFAIAGGFDLGERKMPNEWDRLGVFELVGPRFAISTRSPGLALDWQVAGYADVAMVQAHVFGDMPPPGTGRSILILRGYYYATGATLATRLQGRAGRWDGTLDATAHQFWSFDDHDHGGTMDPHGVEDQRVTTTASIGVRPTDEDVLVHAFAEVIERRGTWSDRERDDAELAAGVGVTARF